MATKNDKIELVSGGRNVNGAFQPNAPTADTFKEGKGIYQTTKSGVANLVGGTGASTLASPSTAITAESLKPVTPIKITAPTPSTADVGLQGAISAGAEQLDTFNQNLAEQRKQAEATKTSSLADFTKLQAQQQGLESLTLGAEEQVGLQDIDTELQDINNEIRQEERALELKLRELDKNTGGLSATGLEDVKYQARKESLQTQADLAIIQQAKQGRFDSAKAIADRKAKMEFEKQNNILEAARTTYLENKELFTTAEQRQFESLSADRERQLAKEQADFKTLQDQKLASLRMASTNGAPAEVLRAIQSATTPEEVISAGGQYGSTDLLAREAQRASIRSSIASAAKNEAELQAINNTASGQSNIAVQALDAFSGSLNENNREQYTKAITGAVKRGSVEQTEISLKNAAQAAAGKALTEDVVKRDQAIGALRDVQTAINEYQASGGNTNLLVGGYENIQNKLGKTTDPKLAAIEKRIGLALNSYTNAVSGASFTPQESARYKALFPSTSNEQELNTASINTLLSTFEANNQVFYGNFYGNNTPSQIAQQAVYEELKAEATDEELAELGIPR